MRYLTSSTADQFTPTQTTLYDLFSLHARLEYSDAGSRSLRGAQTNHLLHTNFRLEDELPRTPSLSDPSPCRNEGRGDLGCGFKYSVKNLEGDTKGAAHNLIRHLLCSSPLVSSSRSPPTLRHPFPLVLLRTTCT